VLNSFFRLPTFQSQRYLMINQSKSRNPNVSRLNAKKREKICLGSESLFREGRFKGESFCCRKSREKHIL
jgi:hypothetical protein